MKQKIGNLKSLFFCLMIVGSVIAFNGMLLEIPVVFGYGGGGGGFFVTPPPVAPPVVTPTPPPALPSTPPPVVLPAPSSFGQQIVTIAKESSEIIKANIDTLLAQIGQKKDANKEVVGDKLVVNLIKGITLTQGQKQAIDNFVTYGTNTTMKLGAGERAGVVNSFKSAFGKLPTSEKDWNDAIKIANGRWPEQRSADKESKANDSFKKIYKREPDRKNPNDDAAVVVMTYGLRSVNRNLNSEKVAIKTFKNIYGYNPKSAEDWDITRAIAYSGATR